MSQNITEIVDRQIDAYNERNIENFAATYHENLELYIFPNDCFCLGKAQLLEQYSKRFSERPEAKATIASRVAMGQFVIDHEILTGIPEKGSIQLVATYEVTDGLISKVWFIYDPQK